MSLSYVSVLDRSLSAMEYVRIPGREDGSFPWWPDLETRHSSVQQVSPDDRRKQSIMFECFAGMLVTLTWENSFWWSFLCNQAFETTSFHLQLFSELPSMLPKMITSGGLCVQGAQHCFCVWRMMRFAKVLPLLPGWWPLWSTAEGAVLWSAQLWT